MRRLVWAGGVGAPWQIRCACCAAKDHFGSKMISFAAPNINKFHCSTNMSSLRDLFACVIECDHGLINCALVVR
jgi:hypothetical protein